MTASTASANFSLLAPFLSASTSSAQTGFSLSTSSGAASTAATAFTVSQSTPGLLVYASSLYSGQSSLLSFNDTFVVNATSEFTPLSLLLSQGVYAVGQVPVQPGKAAEGSQRVTFWGGVADTNELPFSLRGGQWTIAQMEGGEYTGPHQPTKRERGALT